MTTPAGYPGIPHAEVAIYIEDVHRGDHHHYEYVKDTAVERRPEDGHEVWTDLKLIPAVPPPQTPYPGTPDGGNIVRGISGVPLGAVPGNPYRFAYLNSVGASLPEKFLDMVPAPYSKQAYTPVLRDATNKIVPYNPAVWVADGVLSVIEFKYKTPAELGYKAPFKIDYWRYVGGFANSNNFAIQNVGAGAGQVWRDTIAGLASLRTLLADPAAGREGIVVNVAGDTITIGNTMTAANFGSAPVPIGGKADLWVDKTAAGVLRFRKLIAGTNIKLTTLGTGEVQIEALDMDNVTNLDSVGVGTDVWDSTTLGTAHIRRVQADTRAANAGALVDNSVPQTVVVGNTMDGANVGGGVGLFKQKQFISATRTELQFNTIKAGSGISLSTSGDEITIDNTDGGSSVTLTDAGVGAGHESLVSDGSGPALATKGINLGPGGLAFSPASTATDLTIDNTLDGFNLDAAMTSAQIFVNKTTGPAVLNFRSISVLPGNGILLTQGADTVVISATGDGPGPYAFVTSILNEGVGEKILDETSSTATTKRLRTLIPDATNAGQEGIFISPAPGGLELMIGNTLNGANIGVGVDIFKAKTFVNTTLTNLEFRRISAGVGIDITLTGDDISVVNTDPGSAVTLTDGGTFTPHASLVAPASANPTLQTKGLYVYPNSGIALDTTTSADDVGIMATGDLPGPFAFITKIDNEGTGTVGVYDAVNSTSTTKYLRTLMPDNVNPDQSGILLTLTSSPSKEIVVGNTMVGFNLGAPAPASEGAIYKDKTFVSVSETRLNLRKLVAGSTAITVKTVGDTIEIDSTAGSGVTLTGYGTGVGAVDLVQDGLGPALAVYKLVPGSGGISIASGGVPGVVIDNTLVGHNPYVGITQANVYINKTVGPPRLNFRSIIGSTYVSVVEVGDAIQISSVNGVNVIANEGAGTGLIWHTTVGGVSNLRSLIADTAANLQGIQITTPVAPGDVVVIGNTLVGFNLGTPMPASEGAVYKDKTFVSATESRLNFRKLVGSGGTSVSTVGDTIVISSTASGPAVTLSDAGTIGGHLSLVNTGVAPGLKVVGLVAGANISITPTGSPATDLTIAVTGLFTSFTNTGTGAAVYDTTSVAPTAKFRKINAGAGGITVTENALDITIANTLTAKNIGTGIGLWNIKNASNELEFYKLKADTGISLTLVGSDIVVKNTDPGSAVTLADAGTGTHVSLVNDGVGAPLAVKGLKAGTGITFGDSTTDITINATAVSLVLSNTGTGAEVYDTTSVSPAAKFRKINAGTGGITVTQNTLDITIANTLTAKNIGTGIGLWKIKNASNELEFYKLKADTGISLTLVGSDIVVKNTDPGSAVTLADGGTGTHANLVIDGIGAPMSVRGLQAAPGTGITLSQTATDVVIGLTGSATTRWCFRDQKPNGTDGGTFNNGAWRRRDLNTSAGALGVATGNVTLASNQLTFQPGTYRIHVSAPAIHVWRHKCKLYNVTTKSDQFVGTSAKAIDWQTTVSSIHCIQTFAAATTLEVQHQCETSQSGNGFGVASNFGVVEAYTEVNVEQIAV
jgi:hypothetical protein